jgi:YbbR domain-containing protein
MIPSLRHLVLQDFWLKLFSLALAVLIWFTVNFTTKNDVSPGASLSLSPREQRVFPKLPVLVVCTAEDVRNFRVAPKEVQVTVEGDVKALQRLQEKEIRVLVDLTGIGAAHDLRKRIEVSAPAGVTHVRVDPEEVQIIFPPTS